MLTGGLAHRVGDLIGLGSTAVDVWNIAKWPVLLLVVSFMFALLYWAAPNVKQPGFRWVSPGGILAVVGWLIASAAFAFYVGNFGSYNKTYGALGGVIVFLVWLWISNIVILLGAEFNAELERGRAIEGGMRPAGQGAVRRAARHAQDGPRAEARVTTTETTEPFGGYAPPEERPPLAAYATFAAVFHAAMAGAVAAAKRSGRDLPEHVRCGRHRPDRHGELQAQPADLEEEGHRVRARARSPSSRERAGPAELEEHPRGTRPAARARRAARLPLLPGPVGLGRLPRRAPVRAARDALQRLGADRDVDLGLPPDRLQGGRSGVGSSELVAEDEELEPEVGLERELAVVGDHLAARASRARSA